MLESIYFFFKEHSVLILSKYLHLSHKKGSLTNRLLKKISKNKKETRFIASLILFYSFHFHTICQRT